MLELDNIKYEMNAVHNSLKELGKCSTIVQNDVRDNIERIEAGTG